MSTCEILSTLLSGMVWSEAYHPPISQHGKPRAGPRPHRCLRRGPEFKPRFVLSLQCPLQSPTKATDAAAETAEANCPNQNKKHGVPQLCLGEFQPIAASPWARGSKRVLGALLPLHGETGSPVSRQQPSKRPQTQADRPGFQPWLYTSLSKLLRSPSFPIW